MYCYRKARLGLNIVFVHMRHWRIVRFFFADNFKVRNLIYQNAYIKDLHLLGLESGLRYKMMRENSFLMQNATERYINFKKQYPTLENRVRQAHIASYLGITPESLSLIRRVLREEKTGRS